MNNVTDNAAVDTPVAIIGGGPAGLTAGYELTRRGVLPIILEQSNLLGGISRTEQHNGYRFDIGGHRFYTKLPEVQNLWESMLPDDFLHVQRLSRIFYEGKFYHYPLEVLEIPGKLGLLRSVQVLASWLHYQLKPYPQEDTFEHWVSNRFGDRLYRMFFKTYTEKVWGIPCNQIQAEWAAQRIRGLSLPVALLDSLFKNNHTKTLTKEFRYPSGGPGMMWERFGERIQQAGGSIWMNSQAGQIELTGGRVSAVQVLREGQPVHLTTGHVISSMALRDLVLHLRPAPPEPVLQAARALKYRDFIMVGLILDHDHLFADQWIYVHSPEVRVGRVQNFRNWSAGMLPNDNHTSLGMEYFCNQGDELWNMTDADLVELASAEMQQLGLAQSRSVLRGVVIRQPRAYPVYDAGYQQNLAIIREYLAAIPNLQTIGRNGMHRYNNQDHSMLMGLLAVCNYLGEDHDLWNVNVERSYYEELVVDKKEEA